MSNVVPNKKKNSFLREKGIEIAVGLLITLASVFIINRLDKVADNQVDILQRLTAVETQVNNVDKAVEGLSETQGTVTGTSGNNAFELRMVRRDITDLEERIEDLEDK